MIYGVQSLEIQVLNAILFSKECYNSRGVFFLVFILKEKLINSILIKKKKVGQPEHKVALIYNTGAAGTDLPDLPQHQLPNKQIF